MSDNIKIPLSAADSVDDHEERKSEMQLPDFGEAYIKNPFFMKEILTFDEAISCINRLSSIIAIDLETRRG